MTESPEIAQGFDRGVIFDDMKKKLTKYYSRTIKAYEALDKSKKNYATKKKKLLNRMIYLMIAMIQLRNGSRISESVDAIYLLLNNDDLEKKVIVKIAKSKSIKYKKETGEKFTTKTRYRKMIFPSCWIKMDHFKSLKKQLKDLPKHKLRKRVLDFLLKYFECNTHSLRYSWINYMLYDKKKEMGVIAKVIGHSNLNQLVRYTQNIAADNIFDIDI